MSVPSLEDIAFFTSIKYIWSHSQLLPLTVQRVHTALKKGEDSYDADKVYKKIEEITDPIIKKMMQYTCLPLRLRARWVVAFEGLLTQLDMWGFELAKNLDLDTAVIKKTHIKYCMERIVQDQVGQIDKRKTILKILEDSKFIMRFDVSSLFMARHLVEEKELKSISKKVLKEVNKKRGIKMPKLLRNEDVRMVRRNIDDVISWYSSDVDYWHADVAHGLEAARQDVPGFFANTLGLVAARRDLGAVRSYVEQQRRLYPDLLQEQLLEAAEYVLTWGTLSEAVLMFLHDNMEPGNWTRVLEKHIVEVFLYTMQHSWRHRRLCARWFISVQYTLDPVSFRAMFLRVPPVWGYGDYDFYDVIPILQTVWLESPDHLKTDDAFIFEIIPTMFRVKYDVNVLAFFLNYYSPKQQRKLFCQIVICLFENKKEDLIPKCLETVPNLGVNIDTYKIMLNADFLKIHLVQDWSPFYDKVYQDYNGYLDLLSSVIKDFQNIGMLKQELLNDKHFMTRYLNTHWFGEYIYDFLLWCHNGNLELLGVYKSQLLSESLIENVYENILSECGNISSADDGLKVLRFTNGEDIIIKEKILNKSKIKKHVLQTALKCDQMSLQYFKQDLAFYFNDKHEQQTIEELFLCDEGRDAILQLLMPIRFEEDPSLRYPISDLLEGFSQIKNVFFKPYSLEDKIESMLSEYGHPNSRELQIEYYRALSAREISVARKLVDCNYRCVRALLRRDFTVEQLREAERRDVTALSLGLAAQASLDIPVVL